MHPRISLHQVAMLDRPTIEFLTHCRNIGVCQVVMIAGQLATPLPGTPRVHALNVAFAVHPDIEQDSGKAAESLTSAIDEARLAGATTIYLVTGGRGDLSWEEAADRFVGLIAPCRDAARNAGVALLVENANAFNVDIHMAHTLRDTIALAERAEIGLCIDLHGCWTEGGLPALFRNAMPRCGLVQVSDYILGDRSTPCRAVPGDGAIPLERLIGDILDAGYEGLFDIELVGPRIVEEGVFAATQRAAERTSEILERLGV